jgi:hypothetical protein
MVARPVAELVHPVPYDPVPDLAENILGAAQYISPAYWLGFVAEQATGTNPWHWVAEQFAGDYRAAQMAGLALRQLAEFNTVYASTVDTLVSQTVPYDWRGEAATGAQEYLQSLVRALREQVNALEAVGKQFETMAVGVYQATQGFKGFFEMMVDELIKAAVKAALATATAKTIIGGIGFGAAAAHSIWRATQLWRTALTYHDIAWHSVQTFAGVVAGYLGGLKGMGDVPLPAGSYDHPGV